MFDAEVAEGVPAGTIINSSVRADFASWDAIEIAAQEKAVLKAPQLAKAARDVEHILFLWISPNMGDLRSELVRWAEPEFGVPPRALELPPEVDTLIVGVFTESNDVFYRGTRDSWSTVS